MKKYEFDFKNDHDLFKFILTHNYYGNKSEDTIDGYRSELTKVYNAILDERNHLRYAVNTLNEYGISVEDNAAYKEVIDKLESCADVFKSHRDLIDKYVQEKREDCNHEWEYDGHDSHYNYYRCKLCGEETKD